MDRPRRKKPTMRQLNLSVGDLVEVIGDDGSKKLKQVRIAPWRLRHGQWVVGLEGVSGGYDLTRCRPIGFELNSVSS